MREVYVPTLVDRDNPKYWHSRHAVKWKDENGDTHKTFVTPIKCLTTGHLRHIIMNDKYQLSDIAEGTPIWCQVMNVIAEYKKRLQQNDLD